MSRKLTIVLVAALISFVVMYAMFAFGMWRWNPGEWSAPARGFMAYAGLGSTFLLSAIAWEWK